MRESEGDGCHLIECERKRDVVESDERDVRET